MSSAWNKNRLRLGSALTVIGLSMTAGATPVLAQESGDLDQVTEEQSQIVVTGSRIARRDFEANSPIVTVQQDLFESRAAIGVEATLNQLPQFNPAGSASLSSSAGTAFTGADQAPGAATLDLRGLGANRTLVLVNGRRAQPVNGQLVVDVNTIPTAAIRNVEVITGGAAAVYGADAIAGVVNFILRDDFEGFEVNGQAGISEQGDAENYQISTLIGGNFGEGRGNAMVGLTYSDRRPGYQRNRRFYTDGWTDPATQAGGGGSPLNVAVVNGLNYGVNFDGSLFPTNDAANPAAPFKGPLNSLAGGAGFKLNPAVPGSTQQSLGYNDPDNYNSIPLERYTIFGAAHYDITDSVTAFVEANYTHSRAVAQSFAGTAGNIWALQVPYNPANDDPDSPTFGANQSSFHPVSAQLADLLNSRATPAAPWTLSRGLNFLGRLYTETDSDIFQVTAGLRGDVGVKDWTWEVYGSHGNTSVIARQPQGAISYAYLQQLISGTTATGALSPTIDGPWSQNWSSQATFNPSTCTSGIPLFNADGSVPQPSAGTVEGVVVSQDCKDYATLELNNITKLQQNILEATIQGALFNNWAGEVRFAAGATYRDADFSYAPDTGNSGDQPGTGVVNQIALPKPTQGAIDVREIYGELLIPLLSDLPAIQKFSLELGGRYSDYNLSGGIGTYKILGDWEVTDWLRFRGGFQRANRAPNIFELFAPIAGGLGLSSDACLNIPGSTPDFGNVSTNPNQVNVQAACNAAIIRDGGFDYTTLGEDPTAVEQPASDYPAIDLTRLSNFRWTLAYNLPFPFSIGLQQGNTDLDSEKAKTITAGAVIRSPFESPLLDRLTITVDYYSIDLKGTIAAPSGIEIYSQCFNPAYNPLMGAAAGTYSGDELLAGNPYCALINRYPYDERGVAGAVGSGTDRTYQAPFLNKGGTKTSGIDITATWTGDFEDMGVGIPGSLNLYASANILLKFKESAFEGADFIDHKGTLEGNAYDYRLFGTVTYLDDWGSIGLRGRYLPSIDPSYANPTAFPTRSYTQFDLFGRYRLTSNFELRAGVDNLFNAQPPIVGATPTNAAQGTTSQMYDTIGRAYYLGANWRL